MARRTRIRLQPDNRLAFFQSFLRHPREVGSIIPSSRFLERRIVRNADVEHARLVVELGPGTGGTTRALLRAMRPDAKLLAIEVNARFVGLLRRDADRRLVPHLGSATHIDEALRAHGLEPPEVVLSGIPFSTMPHALGRRIVRSVWDALPEGGLFVAYQVRDRVEALGSEVFGPSETQVEILNVPPMRVYRWVKHKRLTPRV